MCKYFVSDNYMVLHLQFLQLISIYRTLSKFGIENIRKIKYNNININNLIFKGGGNVE